MSKTEAARRVGVDMSPVREWAAQYKAGVLPGYSNINGTKFHVNLEALKIRLGCTQQSENDA